MNGIIDALLALGAKNVVLKGVDRQDGIIRNYVASATSGASGKQEIAHDKLPFMTHGTGRRLRIRIMRCGDGRQTSG